MLFVEMKENPATFSDVGLSKLWGSKTVDMEVIFKG